MFLDDLKPGEWAIVDELLDEFASLKLIELGCIPGERILLKLTAPFRDPVVVQVGGNLISLRRSEARGIRIKPAVA